MIYLCVILLEIHLSHEENKSRITFFDRLLFDGRENVERFSCGQVVPCFLLVEETDGTRDTHALNRRNIMAHA